MEDAAVGGERAQAASLDTSLDTNWGMLPAASVTVLSEEEAEEYRARDKAKIKRQVRPSKVKSLLRCWFS